MAVQMLVRRLGNAIDIGPEDGSLIPPETLASLQQSLIIERVEFLRGADRIGSDGVERSVAIEPGRLYNIGDDGRMITQLGVLPRAAEILKRHGHALRLVDISPPRPRPGCYNTDWARLKGLRWKYRQEELVRAVEAAPGGVIQGPPGIGKTEMIARMAMLYPEAKIAIVTKRVDIAKSIYRRISAFMPCGFVGDGKKDKRRVTVYVAKSMIKADPDIDIVFGDEIHELVADEFCEPFQATFLHARCFGFSATPDDRVDGLSMRIESMFGPKLFYMSWPEAVEHGLVIPLEVHWLNVVLKQNPVRSGMSDFAKRRNGIWRNRERNEVIMRAFRSRPADEQDLILVRSVEHAFALKKLLPECEVCYGEMEANLKATLEFSDLLPQDFEKMTASKREKMRIAFEERKFLKAIATDVWSTGVSFDALQAVFRGDAGSTPVQDEQAPGRASRSFEGKSVGLVFDLWDTWDSQFLQWSRNRDGRYGVKGWKRIRPVALEAL